MKMTCTVGWWTLQWAIIPLCPWIQSGTQALDPPATLPLFDLCHRMEEWEPGNSPTIANPHTRSWLVWLWNYWSHLTKFTKDCVMQIRLTHYRRTCNTQQAARSPLFFFVDLPNAQELACTVRLSNTQLVNSGTLCLHPSFLLTETCGLFPRFILQVRTLMRRFAFSSFLIQFIK